MNIKKQSGLSILEFTIVSSALVLLVLGVVNFGHYVYSMQVLSDVARTTARLGTVCYVTDQTDLPGLALADNVPAGFTADNIDVDYLDENGSVVGGTLTDEAVFTTIRYVRARVVDYDYQFVGFLNFLGDEGALTVPEFESTLPIENLGVHSDGTLTDC